MLDESELRRRVESLRKSWIFTLVAVVLCLGGFVVVGALLAFLVTR